MNITDEQAVQALNKNTAHRAKPATQFVNRTIIYPVMVKRDSGEAETEIRTFVRIYEYCSPARWEKALEVEKKYKKLNELYTKSLQDAGKPVIAKEVANPLQITVLGD